MLDLDGHGEKRLLRVRVLVFPEGLWGGAWQVAAQLSEVQSYTSLVLCCFAAVRDMVVDFVVLML